MKEGAKRKNERENGRMRERKRGGGKESELEDIIDTIITQSFTLHAFNTILESLASLI